MRDEESTPALKETAKTVFWGLVFYGGAALARSLLVMYPLPSAAAQAVIAEWGAGLIGVAWTGGRDASAKWTAPLRRVTSGVGLGLGAASVVVVFVLLTHAAALATSAPVFAKLALGLVTAALFAVRDELLLRGLVLRVLSRWAPWPVALAACGVAGAAAAVGGAWGSGAWASTNIPLEMTLAALEGVAFGALWRRDRGAWLAVGAHTAWSWATGPMIGGGLLDVRFAPTLWGGGDAGLRGSIAVAVAAVPLVVGCVVMARNERAEG